MSLPAPASAESLAAHPSLLYAAWVNPRVLWVYRSPIVKDTSPEYAPVRDLLAGAPYTVISEDSQEDEMMFFGRGLETVYRFAERDNGRAP